MAAPAERRGPGIGGRHVRAGIADRLALEHGGVVHRTELRAAGLTHDDIRSEVRAGRWHRVGRHTINLAGPLLRPEARAWWALWETGASAALDGVSSLVEHGLTCYTPDALYVSVPRSAKPHRPAGVVVHQPRELGPVWTAGLPRTDPHVATIRAAQWAATDRQAALLVCLSVQQRLVSSARLAAAWQDVTRSPRRGLIDTVIGDVCDGAHSLGELDFARLCRRHGLPAPIRQSMRAGPRGSVYLDAEFPGGVIVEIDGSHHLLGMNPVDDALRANELTLAAGSVLRVPLLGLRLEPARFMDQVARAVRGSRAA